MGWARDRGAPPRRAIENDPHGGAICTKWAALHNFSNERTFRSELKSYSAPHRTSHINTLKPLRLKALLSSPHPLKTSTINKVSTGQNNGMASVALAC